jgi:hypothetical protein
MASEAQPRRSTEFVESSVLEAIVPADFTIDIEDELESWDGSIEDANSSILPCISQRQVLLFGKLREFTRFSLITFSCKGF